MGPLGNLISQNGGEVGQIFNGSITSNLDPLLNAKECEWVILLYDKSNYKVIQPGSTLVYP